ATLWSKRVRSTVAVAANVGPIKMPWPELAPKFPLLRTIVLETWSWLPATVGVNLIPESVKLSMVQFSTVTLPPVLTRTPLNPVPSLWTRSRRRITVWVGWGPGRTMRLVRETRTPAAKLQEEMVFGLVIGPAPKPRGSRTLIPPPMAVFEIAPAKVLHGAVR